MTMLLERRRVELLNELVINGNPVNLSTGYIVDQEMFTDENYDNGKYYLIILTGYGLTYNFDSGNFGGKGDFIILGIHAFSAITEKVLYTIEASDKTGASFAIVMKNYDAEINQSDLNYTATNGTITIKENNKQYNLDLDLTLLCENESCREIKFSAKGSFEGILRKIVY